MIPDRNSALLVNQEERLQEDTLGAVFIQQIRSVLCAAEKSLSIPENLPFNFNPQISQLYITLFQDGNRPLRWGAKRSTLEASIAHVLKRLWQQPRFEAFDVADSEKCRIMFEIVTEQRPCNIRNLTTMQFSDERFEPGVTGLRCEYKGQLHYFMPTDAVAQSVMGVNQLLNHLSKRFGISKRTNKISERVRLMRRLPIRYDHIKSKAFISFGERTLSLWRGVPKPPELSMPYIERIMRNGLNWLVRNMRTDGSFLYYYDPVKDSRVDFQHPNRIKPLYNNILRHSGGTITLLMGYERFKDLRYLKAARSSIGFLISTLRRQTINGEIAFYPFFNHKAKLGGAGIGLVALMHYFRVSGDQSFLYEAAGLVRHILSRIDADGEMIGYYIHPDFNDGKPIEKPDDALKRSLFSFYYPGEALLGLALYYTLIKKDDALRREIAEKSALALDFLVETRPIKYHHLFEPLPADAWLMQAIESWSSVDGFAKQSYLDFVFDDTQKMFDHMYEAYNTGEETKDYIGGFYYHYGDHVYHDASRNEGIAAAYHLAKSLGDERKASYIMTHMLKSAESLLLTYNSSESAYAHRYPEKSVGSFRFKLTRQWVRVDSVQHAVCFFARLYDAGFTASDVKDARKNLGYIDGYEIIGKIASSGFSDVFLVKDKKPGNHRRILKRLKNVDTLRKSIENEAAILLTLQGSRGIIESDGLHFYSDGAYFLFDDIGGDNLERYVKANGPLSSHAAERLLRSLLNLLKTCRGKGVLHLDIKPANILMNEEEFYLIDWGLAKRAKCAPTVNLKGNPIYFAPETYYGRRCSASEIYALGCSVYEAVTGKKIFALKKRDETVIKMYRHLYLCPDLSAVPSEKLKVILQKMLEKDPVKRGDVETILSMLDASDTVAAKKEETLPDTTDNLDEMLKKMVEDGVPYAYYLMALRLSEGKDDAENSAKVRSLLVSAADVLAEAGVMLGKWYFEHRRYADALPWFSKYKAFLDRDASYYFASMHDHGLEVDRNPESADRYYMRAASLGHAGAKMRLARLKKETRS